MKTMNEKVMNVFNKNNDQLEKELARRGLPYTIHTPCYHKEIITRERAIAEIIYKDAFDCGRSEASHTCPNGCKGKPEVEDYFLHINEIDNPTFNITLTDEQVAFFEWLVDEEILDSGLVSLEPASRIINVGRIE
jgi:hypothetical protein